MKGAMALFVGLAMGFSATAQTPNNSDRKDPTTQKANEKAYFEDSNLKKSTLPVVVNPALLLKMQFFGQKILQVDLPVEPMELGPQVESMLIM